MLVRVFRPSLLRVDQPSPGWEYALIEYETASKVMEIELEPGRHVRTLHEWGLGASTKDELRKRKETAREAILRKSFGVPGDPLGGIQILGPDSTKYEYNVDKDMMSKKGSII